MTDEKPKKRRSFSSGGESPMRRRAAPPRRTEDAKGEKTAKPRFEKARFDKPLAGKARPRPHAARPEAPREKAFEGERIAKVIARAGACSRRDAEQWIADGRVAVNGRVLTSPAFNVREGDKITIDGAPLVERERTRLFLFHKPAGLVTSTKDAEGRETVFDYLARHYPDLPRVVSVGRLDINTEGLLLLTNDGGLARTLELPATGWARRYRVRAHGEIDQAALDRLKKGVVVEGVAYAPIDAMLDRVQGSNAWISMSLREGKNREIKRVLEYLGLDVNRLIRVSFGPFQLGDLGEGVVEEVRLKVLREQLGKGLAELAGVDFSSPLHERVEPTATELQEVRERAQKRTRKHVSALRAEHEARSEKGPRARIERGVTSDRRGRAVSVEKIVAARPEPEPETRRGRSFRALRRAGEAAPPHLERRAPQRGRDDAHTPSSERFERRPNRRFEEATGAPRVKRESRSEGDKAFGTRERAPERSEGRRREGGEGPGRSVARGEASSRPRNYERDDRRSGGRRDAGKGSPDSKSRGGRARSDVKTFEGPRRFEGVRKPGGPRKPGSGKPGSDKPGGFQKRPGGSGKPGGRPSGGPRKPRGPRS
jgi:23S rRNA pseudouridine2605 synthase